jgi:hypothetical protein
MTRTEKDFDAAARIGIPPGIRAAEKQGAKVRYYRAKDLPWVVEHVRKGGAIFVDSGAFNAFRPTAKNGSMDWPKIFRFYHDLLDLSPHPERILLVAPDSVGEQGVTLQLWSQWQDEIRALIARGADVVLPIQGEKNAQLRAAMLPREEVYRIAQVVTGQPAPGVSLPMVKGATSPAQVLDFVGRVRPRRLHLLGLGLKKQSIALGEQIWKASPNTLLSLDAVETRLDYGGKHRWFPAWVKDRLLERAKGRKARDSGDLRVVFQPQDRATSTWQEELDFLVPPGSDHSAEAAERREAVSEGIWFDLTNTATQKQLSAVSKALGLRGRYHTAFLEDPAIVQLPANLLQGVYVALYGRPEPRADRFGYMADHLLERRWGNEIPRKPVPKAPKTGDEHFRAAGLKPRHERKGKSGLRSCETKMLPGGRRQVTFDDGRCVIFSKEGTPEYRRGQEAKRENGRRMACENFGAGCPPGGKEGGARVLVITSCSKRKGSGPAAACNLYQGYQHRFIMEGVREALEGGNQIDLQIISAKHGVIRGDKRISSYDITFQGRKPREIVQAGEDLGIPADIRHLLYGTRYDLAILALGRDYLRAAQLHKTKGKLPGKVLAIGGEPSLLPTDPNLQIVPAGKDQLQAYGGKLTDIKGRIVKGILGNLGPGLNQFVKMNPPRPISLGTSKEESDWVTTWQSRLVPEIEAADDDAIQAQTKHGSYTITVFRPYEDSTLIWTASIGPMLVGIGTAVEQDFNVTMDIAAITPGHQRKGIYRKVLGLLRETFPESSLVSGVTQTKASTTLWTSMGASDLGDAYMLPPLDA